MYEKTPATEAVVLYLAWPAWRRFTTFACDASVNHADLSITTTSVGRVRANSIR